MGNIFDTIAQLRDSGRPFCVATVVRTADATSAKAGAKAAVTETGKILGHLGGACVQRAVREASARCVAGNAPQMIRVKPDGPSTDGVEPDGVRTYRSGCPSGGTVDLLIEPCQPPCRLVILGDTPIAHALAAHAALAGFRVLTTGAVPPGVQATEIALGDLGGLRLDPRDFVVVASQGERDRDALKAALDTPVLRVSMVASRRKAEVLSTRLIESGMAAERVGRLKSPAGLDLLAVDPHDIALSILSEIVLWRNTDRVAAGDTTITEHCA